MTTASKIITLLIMGALLVLIITHPIGFAQDAVAGGSVMDNTLSLESGAGNTGGQTGSVSFGGNSISSKAA